MPPDEDVIPARIEDPKVFFEQRFLKPNPWFLASSPFERQKYLRQISAIREFGHPQRILELGSAEGAFTELLLAAFPNATVEAVEISPAAITRARNRLKPVANRVVLHNADIAEFLAETGTGVWDTVIWSECMHYVARSKTMLEFLELLEACSASLQPKGIFCSVNTIQEAPPREEEPIIARFFKLVFAALSSRFRCRMCCEYIDYKPEENCSWEYQLWLFQNDAG